MSDFTCQDFDRMNIEVGATAKFHGITIYREWPSVYVVSGNGEKFRARSGTRAVFYVNKILNIQKRYSRRFVRGL